MLTFRHFEPVLQAYLSASHLKLKYPFFLANYQTLERYHCFCFIVYWLGIEFWFLSIICKIIVQWLSLTLPIGHTLPAVSSKTIEFMFWGINMFWAQFRFILARVVRRGLK